MIANKALIIHKKPIDVILENSKKFCKMNVVCNVLLKCCS